MKKWFSMLLIAYLLSGCAGEPGKEPAPLPPAAVERMPESGGLRASQVEDAARPLSEEEVLAAYDRAVSFYGWFDLAPLPNDGRTRMNGGNLYRRVDVEGMEDLEDLRTCLRSVFSQEITERLLETGGETPRYQDFEGELYVTGTGRAPDPYKGEAEVQVERTGEAAYSVDVAVELLDVDGETVTGLEFWSFPYAFVDDRWVFTDFRLVY